MADFNSDFWSSPSRPAAQPSSAEDIAALQDELSFQRAMLMSCDDVPALNDPAQKRQIRLKIDDLEARIRAARAGNKATSTATPRLPGSSAMRSTQNRAVASGSNSTPRPDGRMASGVSTPSSYGSDTPSANTSRKRDFSTHSTDGYLGVNGNKSRRTSPAPFGRQNGHSSPATASGLEPEIIDLTGLDDGVVSDSLREQQLKIERQIARTNRDAALARRMANGPSPDGYDSNRATTPQTQTAQTVPSWYDRITGRSAQRSPSNSLPVTPSGPSAINPLTQPQNPPPVFGASSLHSSPLAFRQGRDQHLTQQHNQLPNPFSNTSTIGFGVGIGNSNDRDRVPKAEPVDAMPSIPGSWPGSGLDASMFPPVPYSRPGMPAMPGQSGLAALGRSPYQPIDLDFPDYLSASQLPLPGSPYAPYDPLNPNSRFPPFGGPGYRAPWDDEINDAQAQEELRELLTNIRPDEDVAPKDREGTPSSMRYDLYAHQSLALTWMKKMEEGKTRGGILADDMGLGKTISTLALMSSRQSEDRNVKTNLIVGPVALIRQWKSEIKAKLKPGKHQLSVYLMHGAPKKLSYQELRTYDIVLTTYGTIASEWKKFDRYRLEHKGADFDNDRELHKLCPIVHAKSRWFRVILDEAQCIKNKDTQAALGTLELTATHRWCLTGTPMMNGTHELYSLFRFLRVQPYNVQKKFNEAFQILNPKKKNGYGGSDTQRQNAMKKLQVVLKATMLRRKKDSKIDGKPILSLPQKIEEEVHITFSQDEADFYIALQAKAQITMNKYLRAGTVGKNYSNVLALLLRLRQACCHPHLLQDYDVLPSGTQDAESMKTLARSMDHNVVDRIRNVENFECPICMDVTLNPAFVLPCGHESCSDCLQQLFDNARASGIQAGNERDDPNGKCPQCRGDISLKKVVDYDTFKKVHMPSGDGNDEETAEDDDGESDSDSDSDTEEGDDQGDDVDENGDLKDFVVDDDFEEDDDDAPNDIRNLLSSWVKAPKKAKKTKKSKKSKGKRKEKVIESSKLIQLRKDAHKSKENKKKYMRELRATWQPSAKVDKACELLQVIRDTGEKTIIFSVWTSLLDLLEIDIRQKLPDVKYSRYDGSMSATERNNVACAFQEDPSMKIMLISLKAGNSGLNLTEASHVIMMDPFWNPYIEMQAVDRAHRIGQMRNVHVHRLLVKSIPTVEERIMELQENKKELVEAALDEGESKGLARLSERELGYLFGIGDRPRR